MEFLEDIRMLVVQDDIVKIRDDVFLIPIGTSSGNPHLFVLQKTVSRISATFSSVMVLFNQIMKLAYPTRFRSITLQNSLGFPIGPNYLLFRVSKRTRVMTAGFEPRPSYDFFSFRLRLLRSFAAHAFLRDLFSLRQQREEAMLVSPYSASFSSLVGDFAIRRVSYEPAFYLPDTLAEMFGKSMRGEMALAIGAIAQGFVMNIESVRAFLEVLVIDSQGEDELLQTVGQIEQKLTRLAPPKLTEGIEDGSREWMSGLIGLVDEARVMRERERPRQIATHEGVDRVADAFDVFDAVDVWS
jgi:hypothetical protein